MGQACQRRSRRGRYGSHEFGQRLLTCIIELDLAGFWPAACQPFDNGAGDAWVALFHVEQQASDRIAGVASGVLPFFGGDFCRWKADWTAGVAAGVMLCDPYAYFHALAASPHIEKTERQSVQ